MSSAGALSTAFKAVVVGVAWLFNAQKVAQVEEVGLCASPLGELVVAPLGYEICWGHLTGILPVFGKNRELARQLRLAISF